MKFRLSINFRIMVRTAAAADPAVRVVDQPDSGEGCRRA
jgi:hypothetical protein